MRMGWTCLREREKDENAVDGHGNDANEHGNHADEHEDDNGFQTATSSR